jgi:glucose/arabinose dehydrogenase
MLVSHLGNGSRILSRWGRVACGSMLVAIAIAIVPSAAATVPSGFSETEFAAGLSAPTAMAFAPDGRLFATEQGGKLRVIKNGVLLATPFLTVPVDAGGERGLLGVAFDPAFATNRFVYVYYTATTPSTHNRVSRFTASGDVAVAGSERIIFDLDPLSTARNHNGGAIHFGPDGKLYIATGDNARARNSEEFTTVLGKILRINPDGSIPADNPFVSTTTGKNQAIWALGLRNPFTFTFQRGTTRMFINDVGAQTWEEINDGIAGSNYGWPATEGPTSDPRFRSPIFAYQHGATSTTGCAITGGAFYNPVTAQFPPAYVGDYFFADYCSGWIRKLDPANGNTVADFASGALAPVDLAVGPDGALYYLDRGGPVAKVFRIAYTGSQAPTITTHPASQTVSVGASATFSVSASGTPPLAYQWQRNGVNIAGATSPSYTLPSAAAGDNGARFRARVTNSFGTATSNEAVLTVTSNQAPTATITAPAAGTRYRGGDTIAYSGTGSDPEDGTLGGARFTWRIDFHHASHIHPFMPATSGATSGSFAIPTTGHTESDVWYRVHLTVTDSGGLTSSTFRDVSPRTVQVNLATSPTGLQLRLDGQPVTTPYSFTGVVGVERSLEAVSPQTSGGTTWTFQQWSNGGPRAQAISTPAANTTYTATYTSAAPPPFSVKVDFQPAAAPTVAGYVVDSGTVYGSRGNGYAYGWNADNSAAAFDRNSSRSPDQRYDTLIMMQRFSNPNAFWEIAVPNGSYSVRVVAGDPMSHNSVYRVTAEGVLTVNGTPTETSRWVEGTQTVTVADGRLRIANGAGASANKICFLEITRVG